MYLPLEKKLGDGKWIYYIKMQLSFPCVSVISDV